MRVPRGAAVWWRRNAGTYIGIMNGKSLECIYVYWHLAKGEIHSLFLSQSCCLVPKESDGFLLFFIFPEASFPFLCAPHGLGF